MERILARRGGAADGNKDNPPKTRRDTGSGCTDHGYVLIFVLWAVVILGFVATSFSGSTRNAVKLEKATMERTKNLYAARGAAIYAMNKVTGVSGEEDEDEEFDDEEEDDAFDDDEFDDEDEDERGYGRRSPRSRYDRRQSSSSRGGGGSSMSETAGSPSGGDQASSDPYSTGTKEEQKDPPWTPNLAPYSVYVGSKDCKVYIEDESGKININAIEDKTRSILVEYLVGRGFRRVEADTVTDSVLDWIDDNDLKHLNGAETNYYESLEEPYEAKNAPFDSIEEFALVKGMTPEKFDLVRSNITVYGHDLAVNINFAPKEVLTAIPRITPQGADYIIAHRTKNGAFKSIEDARDVFWHLGIIGSSFMEIRPYLTINNSGYMTIRATCEANDVTCSYRAIVSKVNSLVEVFAVYPD